MKIWKRALCIMLAMAMLLAAAALCACARLPVKNSGERVKHNIARLYDKSTDSSRFVLDSTPIEGSVSGKAYLSTSANGSSSLAWVDSTLYFVSNAGIKQLANGVEVAEISFDGQVCVYLSDGALKLYSNISDESVTVDDGMSGIRQISISPNSKQLLFTGIWEEGTDDVNKVQRDITKLYNIDSATLSNTRDNITAMAVSDDASLLYYMDTTNGNFTVSQNGEPYVISGDCDATTNYNFTNELTQVAYNANGSTCLFDLESKRQTELGSGFGETGKTNMFSISTITLFTYINGVSSFYEGLWTERRSVPQLGGYQYDIGYIDEQGKVEWLVTNASGFKIADKGDSFYWLSGNTLSVMKLSNAKPVELAKDVAAFGITNDGSYAYYISRGTSLYSIKGAGKPKRIDTDVSAFEVFNDTCAYIRNAVSGETGSGELCYARSASTHAVMNGANDIDMRDGMLICYANPVLQDGSILYDAYYSTDGRNYTLIQSGVER